MLINEARVIATQVEKIHRHFRCEICVGLLHKPVPLPCYHEYCLDCIRELYASNLQCPCCPLCQTTFEHDDMDNRASYYRRKELRTIRKIFKVIRDKYDIDANVLAVHEGEVYIAFRTKHCTDESDAELKKITTKLIQYLNFHANDIMDE